MIAGLRYRSCTAGEARDLIDDLVALYAVVFAEPPYCEGPEQVDQFRAQIHAELDEPGFSLVGTWHADALVGMAYGFTMPAGTWLGHTTDPRSKSVSFALMEFGVHPAHRGLGVGRQLHDRLLAGRAEPTATLKVWSAAPARTVYLRWGWQVQATVTTPEGVPISILTRSLSSVR